MDSRATMDKLRKHLEQLRKERRTWEPYWLDVVDYVCPQRGRFIRSSSASEVNNGSKSTVKRVNGVASRALNVLASGMQSGLTSKARQWFVFAHPDPSINKSLAVRKWYDTVREVLEGILQGSNAYSALLHTYFEMAAFGQGAMVVYEHPDKTIFCRPFTAGSYYLSSNEYMEIDTFVYVEHKTARQISAEYGNEPLPSDIRSALTNGNTETRFEVVNVITRDPAQYGITPREDMPVASVHYTPGASPENGGILKTGWYRSFPVLTPRWDAIDADVYGWAPVHDVIDDVKSLQRIEIDLLKGFGKMVSPPMRIPPELERRGLNTQPGALNVVSTMQEHAVAPLYSVGGDVVTVQQKAEMMERSIRGGLYNDLFLALLTQDNPQMTAREVAERHEEKLLMLGPVLERIHYELLDPFLDRVFGIAWDRGMIPEPPPELEGQPVRIEYVSILSQAQKAVGVNRIEQSVQFLGALTPLYPELRLAIDPKKMLDEYTRMIGVQADVFTSDEGYRKAVDSEARQKQMAQSAQLGESIAKSAAAAGDLDPSNIRQLLSGGGFTL